jgi:hypothetical protein
MDELLKVARAAVGNGGSFAGFFDQDRARRVVAAEDDRKIALRDELDG